jgi:dolichol kinase
MDPNSNPQLEPAFSELVDRTEGLQPWRRVFHAGNGLLMLFALQGLSLETGFVVILLGSILTVLLLMDGLRLSSPRVNRIFFQAFSSLASPREVRKLASSTWYLLGVVLALVLYPRAYALAGILVLALADPSAGSVGRTWGKRPFGAGTVLGSTVFFVVALICLLFFVPFWAALATAVVTALVERTPWSVDDNLTIPVTVGGMLLLIGL